MREAGIASSRMRCAAWPRKIRGAARRTAISGIVTLKAGAMWDKSGHRGQRAVRAERGAPSSGDPSRPPGRAWAPRLATPVPRPRRRHREMRVRLGVRPGPTRPNPAPAQGPSPSALAWPCPEQPSVNLQESVTKAGTSVESSAQCRHQRGDAIWAPVGPSRSEI